MEKEANEKSNLQKIAVGTKQLFSTFYEMSKDYNSKNLFSFITNPNCEVYTTVFNIAELFHLIQEREYQNYLKKYNLTEKEFSIEEFKNLENDSEELKNKFHIIYLKINSCIKIEKYYLDENFEKEYAKEYSNHNIFSFALNKFCIEKNIKQI